MARASKLKVYRTPIGFHDAFVAAPSQKAALEAWGSTHDLFARGIAEIVTDPALTAEPLAHPGVVVKRSRGTTAEQIAALPDAPPADAPSADSSPADAPSAKPAPPKRQPAPPRPSRAALDRSEAALAAAGERHAGEDAAIVREQAALDQRRRETNRKHAAELERLQNDRARADESYAAAMRDWRGASS